MAGHATRAVGAAIRAARQQRALSIHELALRANSSASYLSSIERGLQSPTIDYLENLCAHLGLTLQELVPGDSLQPAQPPGLCHFPQTCPLFHAGHDSLKTIHDEAGRLLKHLDQVQANLAPPDDEREK